MRTSPPFAGFGLYDALGSEAIGTLTTGVFLAGFAVELGAPNLASGVLAAVPFFVQLLQIPAVLLVERLRTRRDICVACRHRPMLSACRGGGSALRDADEHRGASLTIYQGMAAIGGCAWNSRMRDLVPPAQYGRFFGWRTADTTAVAITLAFLGGLEAAGRTSFFGSAI
jgi:hypothetical protein